MLKELLDNLFEEKDIVLELINIDNEIMSSHIKYEDYIEYVEMLINKTNKEIVINNNSLFVTEGNPNITIDLLNRLVNVDSHIIIFINQGFIGMNKWLINKYYEITNNSNVELDTGINYNKYIHSGYKVIPVGEEGLFNQVLEDFYES